MRHKVVKYLLTMIFVAVVTTSLRAQEIPEYRRKNFIVSNIPNMIVADSTHYDFVRTDTTESKKSIKNLILSNLFSQNFTEKELQPIKQYEKYRGKVIDSVFVVKARPMNIAGAKTGFDVFLVKTTNALHHLTQTSVIERAILFEPGDVIDNQNIDNTVTLLMDMGIFTSVDIFVMLSEDDDEKVNVYVITQDNFSLRLGWRYRFKRDTDIFLSDRNFMGSGNELRFTYYMNFAERDWAKKASATYYMSNLWKTHASLTTTIGGGHDSYIGRVNLSKLFVTDGDYAYGAGYSAEKGTNLYYDDDFDTYTLSAEQTAKIWAGKSFRLGNYNNNLYFNLGTYWLNYSERPDLYPKSYTRSSTYNTESGAPAPYMHPLFQNKLDIIGTIGFYRQKYYLGNMIYGYGNTENISYGYKLEAIAGYRYGEFQNLPYAGITFKMGNLLKIGYLGCNVNFGTFIVPKSQRIEVVDGTGIPISPQPATNRATQGMVINASLNYFSNLITLPGEYYLRPFFRVRYTAGINQLEGERTTVKFDNYLGLRAISMNMQGQTRLEANFESVLFTPVHLYGFRFAFFGYVDCGTMGTGNLNPFKNEFYGSLGLGVRVRNEKLVFSTLQIRLCVALRADPMWNNSLYNISAEPTFISDRYTPTQPSYIVFD